VVLDIPTFRKVIRLRQPTWFSRLFRGLPSGPPHASSRTTHCLSAIYFRHLRCIRDFHPLARCAAKRTKTRRLTERFRNVKQTLVRGNDSVLRSEESLDRISDNAVQTLNRVEKVDAFIQQFKTSSDEIVTELNAIASITSRSSESANDILSSVRRQREQIGQVLANYNRLEALIRNLEQIVGTEQAKAG